MQATFRVIVDEDTTWFLFTHIQPFFKRKLVSLVPMNIFTHFKTICRIIPFTSFDAATSVMECAQEYRLQPEPEHPKPTYARAVIPVLVLQPLVEIPIIDNHIPLPLHLFTDVCGMSLERFKMGTLAPCCAVVTSADTNHCSGCTNW